MGAALRYLPRNAQVASICRYPSSTTWRRTPPRRMTFAAIAFGGRARGCSSCWPGLRADDQPASAAALVHAVTRGSCAVWAQSRYRHGGREGALHRRGRSQTADREIRPRDRERRVAKVSTPGDLRGAIALRRACRAERSDVPLSLVHLAFPLQRKRAITRRQVRAIQRALALNPAAQDVAASS